MLGPAKMLKHIEISVAEMEDKQQPNFGGSVVKNLPAKQEMQVPSLGKEEPPGEGMATPSSILTWESHGQKSLVGYSPWGCKRIRHS